jgi:hypothetical protein
MALSFIILAINKWQIENNRDLWLLPILLLSTIVLLSHRFTFIFFTFGLVAMTLSTKRALLLELLRIAGLFLAALFLATLWPYYIFLKFIFGESSIYNISQIDMYKAVFIRIWPALIGIQLLILDFRSNWRQPLPWMFGILLLIYILDGIFQADSYGREISYMVIILDITISIRLVRLENNMKLRDPRILNWPFIFSSGHYILFISASPFAGWLFSFERKRDVYSPSPQCRYRLDPRP